MQNQLPSIERLNQLFEIKADGLYWKCGRKAGRAAWNKYLRVKADGKYHAVHRIVFAIANGRFPIGQIDHINGERADNRPENIREASPSQNRFNCGPTARNKSGVKGVWWDASRGKFEVRIQAYEKSIYVGRFSTIEAAEKARKDAERKYFGAFAWDAKDDVQPNNEVLV